jgi:hypothetical protein
MKILKIKIIIIIIKIMNKNRFSNLNLQNIPIKKNKKTKKLNYFLSSALKVN